MPPAELESLVLKICPVGTQKKDLEKLLNQTFRCEWHPRAVGTQYFINLGFNEISDGDQLIESEFAVYGFPLADVATVHFHLGVDGTLKHVKAKMWGDAL